MTKKEMINMGFEYDGDAMACYYLKNDENKIVYSIEARIIDQRTSRELLVQMIEKIESDGERRGRNGKVSEIKKALGII